jgi:DNA invertase Pin-like site-specific DNA recombinase
MKGKPVNAIILVRVSTKEQSVDRQISDLEVFREKQGWAVVEIISSQVSGSKVKYQERGDLDRVRSLVETGKADKLLVHEVSRIGRSPVETLQLVELCHEQGVSVYDFMQHSETLNAKGRPSLYANVILPLLAGLARNENEERRERIMSGLEEARRKGVKLGRPEGTKLSIRKFLAKHKDVRRKLKEGHSIRNTAKITGKGISTVQRVRAAMNQAV